MGSWRRTASSHPWAGHVGSVKIGPGTSLSTTLTLTRCRSRLGLILEGRYYWASADLGGDYIGFDPIDLDGARIMVGINWKL